MGGKPRKNPVPNSVIESARIYWNGLKEITRRRYGITAHSIINELWIDLDLNPRLAELGEDKDIQWITGWFTGVAEGYEMLPEEFLKRYVP